MMKGLFETMATSKSLENEGVWLDLDHSRIRLARAGGANTRYNAAAEKVARDNKRVMALDLMSSERGKQLLYQLYAKHVVLEWETKTAEGEYVPGIGRPGGQVVAFTEENVIETFHLLEDLFLIVKETAESIQFFKQSLLDDVTGN